MLKITLKDLRLFITDKRSVFFTFFMPIALISIFAMAFGGVKEIQSRPVRVLVSDLDQTATSKNVVDELDSLPNIEVRRMPLDSAERQVKTGDESAVLVVGKGFGDALQHQKPVPIEMRYDQQQAAEVGILQQALLSHLGEMIGKRMMMNLPDSLKAAMAFAQQGQQNQQQQSMLDFKMTALLEQKQDSPGLIQAVAGTAVMMLLFGLGAMSAGLLDEKESGTLKKLLYSPINPTNILFGKMLASTLVALLQLTVLFLFASFAFHLDLTRNVPALLLMMLATAYAAAGFGTLIASISKTRSQAEMMSRIIVLSMSAIGGSMIPVFIMPSFMQKISVLSVNYWSIQGFYDIYWRNLAFSDPAFLMRPLMLFLIGTVMIGLGLVFFRRNVLKLS